jgi:hypothetical protein
MKMDSSISRISYTPSLSRRAAADSNPQRELWVKRVLCPELRRSDRIVQSTSEHPILPPLRGSSSARLEPTAHAVGYCLSVLRTFFMPNATTSGTGNASPCLNRASSRWNRFARFVLLFVLSLTIVGCAGPFEIRKTQWTVPEVEPWYATYRRTEPRAWNGILYQGSDTKRHHFIARVASVDNWAIIEVSRNELTVPEELPLKRTSTTGLGYYLVDPTNGFSRVESK